MQATITVVPVSLSLVHIPRTRLPSLSHAVLRQILQPEPAFLNITCNEIELTIFADAQTLDDFEPVARKDRQRQRSRSGSSSSTRSQSGVPPFESVEVTCDRWSVLQIDSHSDQLDNSGTRVHDLSAPLAAAGISILYQSSYTSDFIFVKESRLQDVVHLFTQAGFDLYLGDETSPSLSPTSDDVAPFDYPPALNKPKAAVFTRADPSPSALSTATSADSTNTNPVSGRQSPRTKSHSPTSGEVRLLDPDLACVGLSDEFGVDHWGLKIIKLVFTPELISGNSSAKSCRTASRSTGSETNSEVSPTSLFPTGSYYRSGSSSSFSSEDDDGYFSHSPQNVSKPSLPTNAFRSETDLSSAFSRSPVCRPSSKHAVPPYLGAFTPIISKAQSQSQSTPGASSRPAPPGAGSGVPFFSFTRTREGSSLTADVHLLATLFPPQERHMVICSGELDAADSGCDVSHSSDDEEEEYKNQDKTLKCLQVDLRRFGLDKHGLVNRFSRVLEENGINHMYSSTFKTANLLVGKRNALRAQSLLRAC